ncbi:ubiquitin-conjugating enzyme E2 C-like [Dasypus novemcinctus]|uniref:ubiquitin-conjugating enzyme E2 C-like n=1 Tax=Dasypus novemcinctus TaxID=9361 RepID=UPI00265E5B36|nr:ubiquitin-conjugating enzyme E2 C-like [Dasypus novemcinctus]
MASQNQDPTSTTLKGKSRRGHNHLGLSGKEAKVRIDTLVMSRDKGISTFPVSGNCFKWAGTLHRTAGVPYGYLYNEPTVKFLMPCYEPNVDTQCYICLGILKDNWSALNDVRTVLPSIQSLLGKPSVYSPLSTQAVELWKNPTAFKKHLREPYSK